MAARDYAQDRGVLREETDDITHEINMQIVKRHHEQIDHEILDNPRFSQWVDRHRTTEALHLLCKTIMDYSGWKTVDEEFRDHLTYDMDPSHDGLIAACFEELDKRAERFNSDMKMRIRLTQLRINTYLAGRLTLAALRD